MEEAKQEHLPVEAQLTFRYLFALSSQEVPFPFTSTAQLPDNLERLDETRQRDTPQNVSKTKALVAFSCLFYGEAGHSEDHLRVVEELFRPHPLRELGLLFRRQCQFSHSVSE